jgi:hypothetical protein
VLPPVTQRPDAQVAHTRTRLPSFPHTTAGYGFAIKDLYNSNEFSDTYNTPINVNTRFVFMRN